MITYPLMMAPRAVMAVISWVKHPYKESSEVEVNRLTKKICVILFVSTAGVTAAFFFI